jgi:hypothetical protein
VVFVTIFCGSWDGKEEVDKEEEEEEDELNVDSFCLFLVDGDDGVEEMPEPEPETEDSKAVSIVVGKAKMVEVTVP